MARKCRQSLLSPWRDNLPQGAASPAPAGRSSSSSEHGQGCTAPALLNPSTGRVLLPAGICAADGELPFPRKGPPSSEGHGNIIRMCCTNCFKARPYGSDKRDQGDVGDLAAAALQQEPGAGGAAGCGPTGTRARAQTRLRACKARGIPPGGEHGARGARAVSVPGVTPSPQVPGLGPKPPGAAATQPALNKALGQAGEMPCFCCFSPSQPSSQPRWK